MYRLPVASVVLRSVGYDSSMVTLELEFERGYVYQYFAVPPEVIEGLLAAESKGRYFNREIRGRYPYLRRGQGRPEDVLARAEALRTQQLVAWEGAAGSETSILVDGPAEASAPVMQFDTDGLTATEPGDVHV